MKKRQTAPRGVPPVDPVQAERSRLEKEFESKIVRRRPQYHIGQRLISVGEVSREGGTFHLPAFQREFVWTPQQCVNFLNRLMSGVQFGSILVHKHIDSVGGKIEYSHWVLDGQQRLSTVGATMIRGGVAWQAPLSMVVFDPQTWMWTCTTTPKAWSPTVQQLLSYEWLRSVWGLCGDYSPLERRQLEASLCDAAETLRSAEIHTILADSDTPVDVVQQMFVAINTGGTLWDPDEISRMDATKGGV